MNETTDWIDGFVGNVDNSGTVVLDELAVNSVVSGADTVDLLVDFGTMMVTLLTGSSNREGDSGWMPCSDTGDLAETLVSLSGKFLCVPSRSDTMVTATLGNT